MRDVITIVLAFMLAGPVWGQKPEAAAEAALHEGTLNVAVHYLETVLADTQAAGIQTNFSVAGQVRPIPAQVEFTLYRVVQEGLTNVRKHAQASQVDLLLTYTGHAVQVRLKDDGIGSEQPGGGYGLLGLQERVQLVGGTFAISTQPGEGFMLEASIPV